ncbi:MAG TPA: hypothetical protein VF131_07695 [Blastocatellia bacterium]|nr:hypothetical protein [Blastocatellia bacterium]
MKTQLRLVDRMNNLAQEELDFDPQACALVESFLNQERYQREFCLELLEIARGGRSSSWDIRRLAILMLEHQILKLPLDDLAEFAFLFTKLGLTADIADGYVSKAVLKEGYSTARLSGFVREFCRKLGRLNRVHQAIERGKSSKQALADFIHASRIDCHLALARYVMTPGEVVDRITGHLNKSAGVKDLTAFDQPHVAQEAAHCFERLPRFESEILSALCAGSKIYWVTDRTRSEINSLIEYPLNTVVMVVKPPGSPVEFEIKRAGARGNRPLDAVFERDGCEVPSTHRLHAGSMAYYLRWEAGAAAALSYIYRLIHHTEAPISRTVSVSTIYTVPVNGQDQHILRYFSDLNATSDPDETRRAMRQSIRAFEYESGITSRSLPGDFGLATEFLSQVVPSQAILVGTTSFRLDRLESYLSPEGADIYFSRNLKIPFTRSQARRFADELLDEILGVYISRVVSYENYGQYIDAALSLPDNRARADSVYLSIMRQIGKFWGTLMGMRSHSYGESFVARNVGLKSVFESGEWKVKIVFMDHDAMYLAGVRTNHFHPMSSIPNMVIDENYILGGRRIRGSVEMLRAIYRVDQRVASEGDSALNIELKAAYRRTQDEICNNSLLQECFSPSFVKRLRDWEQIVVSYLRVKDDPSKVDIWRDETARLLEEKKYDGALVREHLRCLEHYSNFLQKYSFLY